MCKILKKTLAVILIGLGIGILLVLLLPFAGWLFVIDRNDNCCKESSKIFKRICKIDI